MKRLLLLLILVFVAYCSSKALGAGREYAFSGLTETTRGKAYERSMTYIRGTFMNARKVLKYSSRSKGIIILKGNTRCNELREDRDYSNYLLQFTLKITISSREVDFHFKRIYLSDVFGSVLMPRQGQIKNGEALERTKECSLPLAEGMLKAIKDS